MATLQSAIRLRDNASPTLTSVSSGIDNVIEKANRLNSTNNNWINKVAQAPSKLHEAASAYGRLSYQQDLVNARIEAMDAKQNKLTNSIQRVGRGWLSTYLNAIKVNSQVNTIERSKQKLIKKSDEFTRKILEQQGEMGKLGDIAGDINIGGGGGQDGGLGFFGKLGSKMIVFNQGIELAKKGFKAIQGAMNFNDDLILGTARLNLINDGLHTTEQLQDKIFAAAERSRGEYQQMSDTISKLGLLAPDAFKTNDELVYFTETLQKSFKVSGASNQESSNAMYQLTQAMASGRLQGDEFRSITENAPMLAKAIADYTGVGMEKLKELSSEGAISADIIKNSLYMAADDINSKFDEMPRTFADQMNTIQNNATKSFMDVSTMITEALNSEGMQKFINVIVQIINWLITMIPPTVEFIVGLITTVGNVFGWLADKIIDYSPVIVAALATIGTILLIGLLPKIWAAAAGFATMGATALAAGIQAFIGWMIGLGPIGLIILALIGVITVLRMVLGSFEKVGEVIGAIIGGLVAYIYNLFIVNLYNGIVSFVEFFANVFTNPVYSIKKLFVSLLDTVLETAKNVAKVIDKIFGSNLAGSVGNLQDKMYNWLGDKPENYKVMEKLEQMDITDAASFGAKLGGSAGKALDNMIDKAKGALGGIMDSAGDPGNNPIDMDNFGNFDPGEITPVKVNGGKLDKQDVEISDEDIKLLKDVAAKEFMIKYKQITPNVNIKFGDVKETADVDAIGEHIKKMMNDELSELYVEEEA